MPPRDAHAPLALAVWLALALLFALRLAQTAPLNAGYIALVKSRTSAGMVRVPYVTYSVPRGGSPASLQVAESGFQLTLAINEVQPQALAGMGRVYSDLGQPELATTAWQAALRAGYQPRLAHLALGGLYAQTGQRELAVDHWRAAVPPDAGYWVLISQRVFSQGGDTNRDGRWNDAVLLLLDGLNDVSDSGRQRAQLHLALSEHYLYLEEEERSLFHAREAVRYDPGSGPAYAWLARVMLRSDEAAAQAAAEQALVVGPTWLAHKILADIHLAHCRMPQAVERYRAGLALPSRGEWRHVYLLDGLARAEWEQGNSLAAIEHWQRFTLLQPAIQSVNQRLEQARAGSLPRACSTTVE